MVGLLWTSDQPVAEASTYTEHHINTRDKHAQSWIRTRDPSNQAAADLRLRPRGHCDRHKLNIRRSIYRNKFNAEHNTKHDCPWQCSTINCLKTRESTTSLYHEDSYFALLRNTVTKTEGGGGYRT
jgi:hypothetical protein